ncbi:lysozyme inhibitor LprI family protein [Mongoliimonas terrestris]|uniref:lysozyme inhibitor LprI family protein n=1 Tax=Mongoliimonas terrestris TaxID=1709001 RepID=UPI00094973CC|nr:lysozyme inhibitor LprI family protein [Mongoliimonas terrestris]
MSRRAALAVLVLLAPAALLPAHADVRSDLADAAATYESCMAEAVQTVVMTGCSDAALTVADNALNVAYKAAVAGLSTRTGDPYEDDANAETLARLKAAQRAWIPFRDANCLLQAAQMLGGTGENQLYTDCLYVETAARAAAIEEQFNPSDM